MSSLSIVLMTYDWGGEMTFTGEEGVGIGGQLPPSMLKSPDFKTSTGVF